MSNKFHEAINESLRATESAGMGLADLRLIAKDVNEAIQSASNGMVGAKLVDTDEFHDLVIESDHDHLILCRLSLAADGGYPVIMRSSRMKATVACLDKDSLEGRIADLLREAWFAHQVRLLMNPAQ